MSITTNINNLKKIVYEDIREAVVFTDVDGNITYYNFAADEMFNFSDESEGDALGKPLLSFINSKKNPQLEKNLNKAFDYFGYARAKGKKKRGFFAKKTEDEAEHPARIFDELSYEVRSEDVGFYGANGVYLLNLCFRKFSENDGSEGMALIAENVSYKRKMKQTQRDSSVTFSAIITCITIYLFFWSLMEFTLEIHLDNSVYTEIIEGIAFLMFLCLVLFTSLSLKDMGLFAYPKRFVKSILQVIPIILIVAVIMIVTNVVLKLNGYSVKEKFIGGSLAGFTNYFGVSLLQEFLARGVIQTSVGNLIRFKWQTFSNVVIATMIFSMMHLPFGFEFMLGSFVMGIALGVVYEKQNNIWGCVLIHWLVGYLAMAMFL